MEAVGLEIRDRVICQGEEKQLDPGYLLVYVKSPPYAMLVHKNGDERRVIGNYTAWVRGETILEDMREDERIRQSDLPRNLPMVVNDPGMPDINAAYK